jgi:hypothetical protein
MLAKRQPLSRGAKNQAWADLEQLHAAERPEIRGTSASALSGLAWLGIWAVQSPQQVIHETLRNSFKASKPWPHHPCLPSQQKWLSLHARQLHLCSHARPAQGLRLPRVAPLWSVPQPRSRLQRRWAGCSWEECTREMLGLGQQQALITSCSHQHACQLEVSPSGMLLGEGYSLELQTRHPTRAHDKTSGASPAVAAHWH